MYFQPNSCNTHADREWARVTFLRQQRKVPPAHAQRMYKKHKNLPPGALYFSACPSDLSKGENMPGQIEKT